MTSNGDRRLLVGVDASDESHVAVDWAAAEARARATRLTVCHIYDEGALMAVPISAQLVTEIRARARRCSGAG
jgi:nucleotide-binding universal stress UspA family protein